MVAVVNRVVLTSLKDTRAISGEPLIARVSRQSIRLRLSKKVSNLSQEAALEPANGQVSPEQRGETARGLRDGLAEWLDPTKRRALIALGIRIAGAALAYIMQILLAQWMGLVEYGVFVGVWVWLLVLGGIAPLGFNISAIGLLSTYQASNDLDYWRGLLATSVVVTLGVGLLIAGLGWTVIYLFPALVSQQYLMPLWLCMFCVPLLALSEMNEGISRAHGWMNTALAPTYLLRPVLLVGGAYIALHSGASLDARMVMSLAIMACLITVIVQCMVLLVRLRQLGGNGRVTVRAKVWVIASLPIVLAQTFELLTQNFDLIAVSYFLGPEATGVYFAALKTIALLAFVNFAIGAASANRLASLHSSGKHDEFRSVLDGAINLAFWPTLLGAMALVLLSPTLLSLFGQDFAAYANLTFILAIGFVAKSFVGPAELYLNVLGQQKSCALALLAAAAINIVLNAILIPLLGLFGAALATTISLVALSASLYVIAKRRIGVALRPTIPLTTMRKIVRVVQS